MSKTNVKSTGVESSRPEIYLTVESTEFALTESGQVGRGRGPFPDLCLEQLQTRGVFL